MKRTRILALAALMTLTSPALTGCFSGMAATTNMQATMNTGNGAQATAGAIHIENATLVAGPEGSTSATLTTRIVNAGLEPDVLVYATINGQPAYVTEGAGALAPGASVSFGFDSTNWINAYALDVSMSSFVPVELGFQNAGLVKMSVLTVQPTGYYDGIVPTPATDPAGTAAAAA